MFIYIKTADRSDGNRYIVNKISEDDGYYFELSLFGRVKSRTVRKAVKRCEKGLPLVSDGVLLPRELQHRQIDVAPFNTLLLINAFCEIISGQRQAIVCDPNGLLTEQLLRPLTKVGALYVFTQRPDIYRDFSSHALRTVGISPILIDNIADIHAPVALTVGGRPEAQIILGAEGFMPCGERIYLRGKPQSRLLSAAKYLSGMNSVRFALPEKLTNGALCASASQLKTMLDTTSQANYN